MVQHGRSVEISTEIADLAFRGFCTTTVGLNFDLILQFSILSTLPASKQSKWHHHSETKAILHKYQHLISGRALHHKYFLGLRFREFWKTNLSIVPKFLTVMTRGLLSSTEVFMTLITVHTAPVATCSSPEIDSRVLVLSCPVASRLSRHVPFWQDSPSAAPLPGPPSRHCVQIFSSPLQQQNCWGTGHRVLSQKVSTPDSVTSYSGAVDDLAPTTGD